MTFTTPLPLAMRNFNRYVATLEVARTVSVQGSDDSDLFTLDFAAGEFSIVQHTRRGVELFARCSTLAELKAARGRMMTPNEEGEGCGHVVTITVAADRAMRRLAR